MKWLRGHSQIVQAQIKQKREPHQLEVSQVLILVLIKRLEPPIITLSEHAIMFCDPP